MVIPLHAVPSAQFGWTHLASLTLSLCDGFVGLYRRFGQHTTVLLVTPLLILRPALDWRHCSIDDAELGLTLLVPIDHFAGAKAKADARLDSARDRLVPPQFL